MTENIDGIIYFNHDEEWAKKKVSSFLKKNLANINGVNNFSNIKIDKVYIPFYEYKINGNIHSFISFLSEDMQDFYEVEVEATRKFLSNDANDLKENFIKGIMPYKADKLEKFDKNKVNGTLIEFSKDETKNKINEVKNNIEELPNKKISDYSFLIGEEEIRKAFEKVAINSCYTSYTLGMQKECDSIVDYTIKDACKYYYPLWIVKIEDNGELYEYYINDQTGAMIGDIKEAKKNIGFRILMSMLIFLVILPILTFIVVVLNIDKTILYSLIIGYMLIGFVILIAKVYSGFKSEYEYGKTRLIDKKIKSKKRYTFKSSFEKARDNFFEEQS